MLHSVICSIHRNIETNSNVLCDRSCGSAESFAQKIEQVSPSFTIGRQEDPSEFLVYLLDHLVTCLTPNKSMINVNLSKTPIEYIFGLEIQSISTCKVCLRKSIVKNWECFVSVYYFTFNYCRKSCSIYFKEELYDENLYERMHCQKKVPTTRSLQISKALPVIFIQLKWFTYDKALTHDS